MNVIQTQIGLSEKVQGSKANVNFGDSQIVDLPKVVENSDSVSKTSANDEIVAKVLSYKLGQSIVAENQLGSKTNKNKLDAHQSKFDSISSDSKQFSIEKVASNVTNFVTNALTKFIHNGHNEEQVTYFKNQAIAGVEHGIEQAKVELAGLVNNDVFNLVDKTKDTIIKGIDSFDVPNEFNRFNLYVEQNEENANASIFIKSNLQENIQITFDSHAIAHDKLDGKSFSITTNATNTLVSIDAAENYQQLPNLADLINKTDDVLNTFYRKDIESAYTKSLDLGYTKEELLSQAKHIDDSKITKQVEKYDQIKHFIEKNDALNFESPKAVAEYINKYMNVLQTSKDLLANREDFNQIINGIVNQMKDVQVPDLLHAINKFHSFNKKFDL